MASRQVAGLTAEQTAAQTYAPGPRGGNARRAATTITRPIEARARAATGRTASRPALTISDPTSAPPPMPIWNPTTYRDEAVSADRGATRSTAACRTTGSAVKPAPHRATDATVPTVEP